MSTCAASLPGLAFAARFDSPLDRGISYAVKVLLDAGLATYESCEGGHGHAFHEPTVRFMGDRAEGLKAAAAALDAGLPIYALRRCWSFDHGELTGPHWELVFWPRERLIEIQQQAEASGLIS